MNKQYIKPTSTSINFEMRESVLLNGSNGSIGANRTERSDLDAAMSEKKENNIWNNNLWNNAE